MLHFSISAKKDLHHTGDDMVDVVESCKLDIFLFQVMAALEADREAMEKQFTIVQVGPNSNNLIFQEKEATLSNLFLQGDVEKLKAAEVLRAMQVHLS